MTEGRDHIHAVGVYEDTDAGGVVYYANYFRFIPSAHRDDARRGVRPHPPETRTGSRVLCEIPECRLRCAGQTGRRCKSTRVINLSGASIGGADRRAQPEDLVMCTVRLVCLHETGRPVRLPADLRARLDADLLNPMRDN